MYTNMAKQFSTAVQSLFRDPSNPKPSERAAPVLDRGQFPRKQSHAGEIPTRVGEPRVTVIAAETE